LMLLIIHRGGGKVRLFKKTQRAENPA